MRSHVGVIAVVVCASMLFVGACSDSESGSDPDEVEFPSQFEFGGDRPVFINIPASYTHTEDVPLLVVLHGYGANGFSQAGYTGFNKLVDEAGVLMIAPEGTVDSGGKQFWNATDACCDFGNTGVDDVSYIATLIEDISDVYRVDPKRVYLFGHSNGGYMSYRMACERADLIAGIASLAGATFLNPDDCAPTTGVSVLQIHGDLDTSVEYDGTAQIPSAHGTVERWGAYDGCAGPMAASTSRLDVDTRVVGEETLVEEMGGCPNGLGVELWTIEGGGHLPVLGDGFRALVWEWLSERPKL